MDLAQLSASLRSGQFQLTDLMEFLEDQFHNLEPVVEAFLPEQGRFERLRDEARRLEIQYPDPVSRPILYGIPIGVKDIFHVSGFDTHAGSELPPARLTGEEAYCVSQLKAVGALVFGKTVTTEFAYFAPGPTRNPHQPDHTPGGSSSGSAAAVGAGMLPLALGTQTIGSIIRPAAFCGVVGFKPSYDRIRREGVIPLSPSLDHIGVFTTSVSGALLVASVLLAGWDLPDEQHDPVLGIPVGPYLEKASQEALDHFQACVERLKEAGYAVKEVPAMTNFGEIVARHQRLLAAEAAEVHKGWYAEFEPRYHPKTAELIRSGMEFDREQVAEARAMRKPFREELISTMEANQIDLWIAPSAPGPAPKGIESTGDPVMNLPWTQSGLPTVSIPSGFNAQGLPMGLQLIGSWYADEALLSWSNKIEAQMKAENGSSKPTERVVE